MLIMGRNANAWDKKWDVCHSGPVIQASSFRPTFLGACTSQKFGLNCGSHCFSGPISSWFRPRYSHIACVKTRQKRTPFCGVHGWPRAMHRCASFVARQHGFGQTRANRKQPARWMTEKQRWLKRVCFADRAERLGQCAMREWLSSHNSSSTKASGSMPALQ